MRCRHAANRTNAFAPDGPRRPGHRVIEVTGQSAKIGRPRPASVPHPGIRKSPNRTVISVLLRVTCGCQRIREKKSFHCNGITAISDTNLGMTFRRAHMRKFTHSGRLTRARTGSRALSLAICLVILQSGTPVVTSAAQERDLEVCDSAIGVPDAPEGAEVVDPGTDLSARTRTSPAGHHVLAEPRHAHAGGGPVRAGDAEGRQRLPRRAGRGAGRARASTGRRSHRGRRRGDPGTDHPRVRRGP